MTLNSQSAKPLAAPPTAEPAATLNSPEPSDIPVPRGKRSGGGSDFAELSRRITEAGLMRRRPGYYVLRVSLVAAFFAGGWVAFAMLGESWWQLAVAVWLGVAYSQIALVAHDLAHRQVFRKRRASEVAGRIAGNLCIGMSYSWWQDKHTRHHANPNHEELDPDVNPDVLVWSQKQARAARGIPKVIGRVQGYIFFPLLTLEGMNLHVAGVRAMFKPGFKQRGLEATLLGAHLVGYPIGVFLGLPFWQAMLFMAVHQAVFGVYLGSTFAPNHKGMPQPTPEEQADFLRKQVVTSRNVTGGLLIDLALGGLNHQIEHHLFPSMPSLHLRRARPIVKGYCAELGVRYTESSLISSYAQALRHLHQVGAPIRAGEGSGQAAGPGAGQTAGEPSST